MCIAVENYSDTKMICSVVVVSTTTPQFFVIEHRCWTVIYIIPMMMMQIAHFNSTNVEWAIWARRWNPVLIIFLANANI